MLWMDELVLFLVNELFRQDLESLSVVVLCTRKVRLPSEYGFAHLQILASL
jgi:hypothetical protein